MSAYVSQNIYYQILKKCSEEYSVAVKTIITFGHELDVAQKKKYVCLVLVSKYSEDIFLVRK